MNEVALSELRTAVESLQISSDEEYQNSASLVKKANDLKKEVRASHREEKAKYNQLHREAVAREKEDLKPIEDLLKIIKDARNDYYMKSIKPRNIEIQKQQEEEKEFLGEVVTEGLDLGSTYVKKTWKARVTDADRIPEKWGNFTLKVVDMGTLNDIAKTTRGEADIPGVEFYQDETLVVR